MLRGEVLDAGVGPGPRELGAFSPHEGRDGLVALLVGPFQVLEPAAREAAARRAAAERVDAVELLGALLERAVEGEELVVVLVVGRRRVDVRLGCLLYTSPSPRD